MTVPSRRSRSLFWLAWGNWANPAKCCSAPMQVNMLEAKSQLSKLVKAAMAGSVTQQ